MKADNPKISKVFEMLLPMILPNIISFSEEKLANKLTMSSGNEVPRAKILKPMIASDTPHRRAKLLAESISQSLPFHKQKKPTNKAKNHTISIFINYSIKPLLDQIGVLNNIILFIRRGSISLF